MKTKEEIRHNQKPVGTEKQTARVQSGTSGRKGRWIRTKKLYKTVLTLFLVSFCTAANDEEAISSTLFRLPDIVGTASGSNLLLKGGLKPRDCFMATSGSKQLSSKSKHGPLRRLVVLPDPLIAPVESHKLDPLPPNRRVFRTAKYANVIFVRVTAVTSHTKFSWHYYR